MNKLQKIELRVSADQKSRWERVARQNGLSLGQWLTSVAERNVVDMAKFNEETADLLVDCIKSIHNSITHLGGKFPDGRRWKWTQQRVISMIEANTHTFHKMVGGERVDIRIEEKTDGKKYLSVIPDTEWYYDLRVLEECP